MTDANQMPPRAEPNSTASRAAGFVAANREAAQREWPYASFWRRVAAWVIDSLILTAPAMALSAYDLDFLAILLLLAYGTYFESSSQRATWGKQACGLTVEHVSGETLSVGRALGRQLLKLLANVFAVLSWLIFFAPVAFTEKKQGLHDLAVSSVVRHEPRTGMADWLVGVFAAVIPATAVIGVLAAVMMPAYQDYVMRAKVFEARSHAAPLRMAVDAAYAKSGKLPANQSELDPALVQADASVDFKDGRITMTANAGGKQILIHLTPTVESNRVTWACSAENLRRSQVPADCR